MDFRALRPACKCLILLGFGRFGHPVAKGGRKMGCDQR